jgi:hypothetical protein
MGTSTSSLLVPLKMTQQGRFTATPCLNSPRISTQLRALSSIESDTLSKVDELIDWQAPKRHPAHGNRSEFVRLAIEHELARWRNNENGQAQE